MAEQFNRGKFEELVLYFAENSADDPLFGATKLNKLLFFADFLAFAELGHSITGASYQALPNGPAPKELLRVERELLAEGSLKIDERSHFRYKQKRPVALRAPNLDVFEEEERAHLAEFAA